VRDAYVIFSSPIHPVQDFMSQIIATAEPFYFPGSSVGCLLIHGFTGTPKEMRWMGEYLSAQGFSVLGVRLTGHATHPQDMIRSRWTDWVASVEDGYHLLRGGAEHIYLVGLSMGGALSLLLSTRLQTKGVAVISTPVQLTNDWRMHMIGLLSHIWPFIPKSKLAPDSGWFDTEAWKDHISYPRNPLRSIVELNKLLIEMRANLSNVQVPVLLIHSKDDNYISPSNLEILYAGLIRSMDKTKLYISGSGHVATRDAVRAEVFEAVARFIKRVESESG
jgi:carboxylesterase